LELKVIARSDEMGGGGRGRGRAGAGA